METLRNNANMKFIYIYLINFCIDNLNKKTFMITFTMFYLFYIINAELLVIIDLKEK